jgi:hypothetical protein
MISPNGSAHRSACSGVRPAAAEDRHVNLAGPGARGGYFLFHWAAGKRLSLVDLSMSGRLWLPRRGLVKVKPPVVIVEWTGRHGGHRRPEGANGDSTERPG